MNRLYVVILAAFSPLVAHATTLHTGASLTLGPVSSAYSISAARHNPAMADLAVRADERLRFNYLPIVAVDAEFGNMNNFVDEVDELIDLLDDPSATDDSIEETLNRFNRVLEQMGTEGYVRVQAAVTAPLTPLYWRPSEFSGTFFVEAEFLTQVHARVLDAPIAYDNQNTKFTTASSAYLKSGLEQRIALGYSRPIFGEVAAEKWGGRLYGGLKLNLINMELSKQIFRLQALDGKDIEDVIEDEYKHYRVATTNVAIDVGLTWVAPRYRAGLTIHSINSPEFDYGVIGENCGDLEDGGVARSNCEAAAYFIQQEGRVKAHEVHTRHAIGTVDAAYFVTPRFVLAAATDLAAHEDMVGSEYQWFHASAGYDFASRWIPDLRLGYRQNLAGSELSSVAMGFTLFNSLSLDAEVGLDEIEVDGSKVPRRVGFSLSFSESF